MTTTLKRFSHESPRIQKDEWLTPPDIVHALGHFDLDPCAPVKCPDTFRSPSHHFTRFDDGLNKQWRGRVWLNPPYGQSTGKWLARLAHHNFGTALIMARTETQFFHSEVWNKAKAIFFFKGRLHFHHVDGKRAAGNCGAPACLVAYGKYDADRLAGFENAFRYSGKLILL